MLPGFLKPLFSRVPRRASVPRKPGKWCKFDLVHALADLEGAENFLEISTASTGGSYRRIDRSRFKVCRRLAYCVPQGWTDNAPIDYSSPDLDTSQCIRQIREQGLRFDIIFIDAWHEYEIARRDFENALSLVRDRGIVVAHDCLPEGGEEACSPYRDGKFIWAGVSYKHYFDELSSRNDLWYCTVDTDNGCGMVRKWPKTHLYRRGADSDPDLVREWRSLGSNYGAAYKFYELHRNTMMNVVTVADFLAAERQPD